MGLINQDFLLVWKFVAKKFKRIVHIIKILKASKRFLDQLDLNIENREKELARTYLVEELNKIKDKKG